MTNTVDAIWTTLTDAAARLKTCSFASLADHDPDRLRDFEIALDGLRLTYAFQRIDRTALAQLIALADERAVERWRDRMFAGEIINTTERRAVLHTALRRQDDEPVQVDGVDIMPEVRATQARIAAFVDQVRSGARTGSTGKPFQHIVNIGIGGSDLGPRLAVAALQPYGGRFTSHFVANADAFDLDQTLARVDPETTLFVVVSKTFTTQETLLNATTARRWLADKLGEGAVGRHFVAVSVNATEVAAFGIAPADMFPIWDWVGGRFSLWSAVGLSVALAIGNDHWRELLRGAAAMDDHFRTAPPAANMPIMLAMLGIWNRNFLGAGALAILPYCERLRELPRYLQQLDMESNGKAVTRDGAPVACATAPVIFGECGTVGQHSFHQWLHQGTDAVPADFIGVMTDDGHHPHHHQAVLAHLAAQIGALAYGQSGASAHDVYAGGRSCNLLTLDMLDPRRLGMLLALYEHKIFVQGIVWGINSFDQPGVELGKRIAKGLESGDHAALPPMLQALHRSFSVG